MRPVTIRSRYALLLSTILLASFTYSIYNRPLNADASLPLQQTGLIAKHEPSTFDAVWQRSKERLLHLDQEGSKSNRSQSHGDQLFGHLHVDIQRKVLYCFVPKVACTSWKRIFMKILGLSSPSEDINAIPRVRVHTSVPLLSEKRFRKDRDQMLKTYRKFLFVRHPFDRVLAAYKDKLLHKDDQSRYDFQKSVGRQIETTLRRPSTQGHNVTFPDFMEWLTRAEDHPTPELLNEHWVSVHEVCSPCSVRYDFLGMFETLTPDAMAVLEWLQVTGIVAKFPEADRPSNAGHFDPRFYDQLSEELKQAFLTKYHDDFVPFQYQTAPERIAVHET